MVKKKAKLDEKDEEGSKEFGAFEKHTKGIGMKLLLKMGFKPGQGLGKEAEGRAEPVQIKLRPKGVGIGFSGDEMEEEEEVAEASNDRRDEREKRKDASMRRALEKAERSRKEAADQSNADYEIEVFDVNSKNSNNVQIIDMQKAASEMHLGSLLKSLAGKKRKEKAACSFKQTELDASLQALKRNIEEVEKERKRLSEIQKKNELKHKLAQFYDQREEFKNDFRLFCLEIKAFTVEKDEEELFERVVCSVLALVLEKDVLMNCERMSQLKDSLSKVPFVYDKVIYHLWWPLMRSSCFSASIEDATAWRVALLNLRNWAHLLPHDFLTLFIGNQILIPRFHSLLKCDDEFFVDFYAGGKDQLVLDVWELMRFELKLEAADILLVPEIVSWLQERIMRIFCGDQFDALVDTFAEKWQKRKLLPSSELKRLKERAWLSRIQKLLQRELEIDPSDQDLKPIDSSIKAYKTGIVSKKQIIELLADHLIPKLRRCVQKWLKAANVDFEEVAEWYVGWKEYLPAELLIEDDGGNNRLIEGFGEILEVINTEL